MEKTEKKQHIGEVLTPSKKDTLFSQNDGKFVE